MKTYLTCWWGDGGGGGGGSGCGGDGGGDCGGGCGWMVLKLVMMPLGMVQVMMVSLVVGWMVMGVVVLC